MYVIVYFAVVTGEDVLLAIDVGSYIVALGRMEFLLLQQLLAAFRVVFDTLIVLEPRPILRRRQRDSGVYYVLCH